MTGKEIRLTADNMGAYHDGGVFHTGDTGTVEGPHPIIPGWWDLVMDPDKAVVPAHESQFEVVPDACAFCEATDVEFHDGLRCVNCAEEQDTNSVWRPEP